MKVEKAMKCPGSASLFRCVALFAVVMGVSGSASALQPLIPDDTGTQGAGGNQLEASYSRDRTRVGGDTERVHTVPLGYTYGLTDSVDIYASVAWSRIRVTGDDASGLGNTVVAPDIAQPIMAVGHIAQPLHSGMEARPNRGH